MTVRGRRAIRIVIHVVIGVVVEGQAHVALFLLRNVPLNFHAMFLLNRHAIRSRRLVTFRLWETMLTRLVFARLLVTVVRIDTHRLIDHDASGLAVAMRVVLGMAVLGINRIAFGHPFLDRHVLIVLVALLAFGLEDFTADVHGDFGADLVVVRVEVALLGVRLLAFVHVILATGAAAAIVLVPENAFGQVYEKHTEKPQFSHKL